MAPEEWTKSDDRIWAAGLRAGNVGLDSGQRASQGLSGHRRYFMGLVTKLSSLEVA